MIKMCICDVPDNINFSIVIGGYLSVVSSSPIKGCFLEQETLLSLLSSGWIQERIWAWFT